jgi:pimeloyl-ACP methyl ester carboxylesterase
MTHTQSSQKIHYTASGDGPPVILIHGMAASLNDWNSLAPALARCGYRSYALDLPGHGHSVKPDEVHHYQIERLYRSVRSWIESLKLTTAPLLVGHSLGGYLSLLYARRQPERVRGQVLINPLYSAGQLSPVVRVLRRRPGLGVRAMSLAPSWVVQAALKLDAAQTNRFSHEARRQIVEDYKRASPKVLYLTRSIPDLTTEAAQVEAPTLVMWGEKDLTLKPESFQRLAAALPDARSACIPGCGHQPHIGRPEIVNRYVLEFFDDVLSRRPSGAG